MNLIRTEITNEAAENKTFESFYAVLITGSNPETQSWQQLIFGRDDMEGDSYTWLIGQGVWIEGSDADPRSYEQNLRRWLAKKIYDYYRELYNGDATVLERAIADFNLKELLAEEE